VASDDHGWRCVDSKLANLNQSVSSLGKYKSYQTRTQAGKSGLRRLRLAALIALCCTAHRRVWWIFREQH